MRYKIIAESPIRNAVVAIGPIAGNNCFAKEAPPCTQIIDKMAAVTAKFVFRIMYFT
jgi:hypothetical protein